MVKLPNSETPITDLPDREELVGILQRALNECDDSALKNNNSSNVPHLAQYGRRYSADSHPVESSDVFSFNYDDGEPLEGQVTRRRLPPARQESCREFSFGNSNSNSSPKMNKSVVIPRRSSMCGPYPAYLVGGFKKTMLSTSPNAQQTPKRFSLSNYDDDNNASTTPSSQQQQQQPAEVNNAQPMDATVSAAADAGAAAARSFLLEALGGGGGGGGAQPGADRASPLSFLGDSLVGAQHQSTQQQSTQQQEQVNRRSSVGPGGGGACYNPPMSFTLSSASAATRNALTEYHRNAVGRRSSDSLAVPPMCHSTFDRRLSAPFDFDAAPTTSPYNAPLDRRDSQRSIATPPSPSQQAGGPIRRRSSITSGATAAVRRNSLSNTAKDVKVHKAGQTAQRRNSMSNNNTTTLLNKDGSEKKRTWKKPKDKPRRPLSAYNLFFKSEREVLIKTLDPLPEPVEEPKPEKGRRKRRHRKTHGKIGFADLARNIAEKWKNLEDETRAPFEAQALKEKERYRIELEAWNKKKLEEQDKAQVEAAAAKEEQQCENEGEQQEQSKEVEVKKEEEQDEPKPTVVKSESQQVEQKPSSPPLQSQESRPSSSSDDDDDETMSEANDKVGESLSSNQTKHSTSRPSKFQPMSSLRLDGSSSMMDELAASIQSSDLKDMDSIVMNQSTFFDDEPLPHAARGNNCSGSITPLPANFASTATTTTMDASEIDQRLADVLSDQDAEVEKLFTSLGTMHGSAMDDAFGLGGDEFMKFDLSSTGVDAATIT